MPKPQKGESKDDFVKRCIPIVLDEGTAETNDQAVAICFSMWEQAQSEGEAYSGGWMRAYRAEQVSEAGPITFVASTGGVKRDGLDLDPARWDLGNYLRNPVVLWAHDYMGQNLPIGRAAVELRDGKLMADILFDTEDPFAAQVERKYRAGFLNAVSVGWDTRKSDDGPRYDLLDISAVPVPGDPDALMERQRLGLRSLRASLDDILSETEPEPTGEEPWADIAAAMVDVYVYDPDDPDEERRKRYNALLPKYRRLGKEPPEWIPAATLSALTCEQVRGLFLEGEEAFLPEEEGPLVIEGRALVEQVVTMLQDLLARGVPETEPEPEPEPLDPNENYRRYLEHIYQQLSEVTK